MDRRSFLAAIPLGTGVVACDAAIALSNPAPPAPRQDYNWNVLSGAPIDEHDLAYARAWLMENYGYEWSGQDHEGLTRRGEKVTWDHVIQSLMRDGFIDDVRIHADDHSPGFVNDLTITLSGPWCGEVSDVSGWISHAMSRATVKAICAARSVGAI